MGLNVVPRIKALDTLASPICAIVIVFVVLGGLATLPLQRAGLAWPFYWSLVGVGVLSLVTTPIVRWRTWAPWTFVSVWAVLVAWMPSALARAPDVRAGRIEVDRLTLCLIISVVLLVATRGSRVGLTGVRVGWMLGLVVSVAIGAWEIVTKEHLLFLDSRGVWVFGEGRLAAGTFINPNNFATVLVGMIVGTLALRAAVPLRTTRGARRRLALDVLAVAGAVIVVFTQSRSALIALAVVILLEVLRRRPAWAGGTAHDGSDNVSPPVPKRSASRRRRWWAALAAASAVGVASVTVPAVARHNPLVELMSMLGNDETSRSDNLRIELIRAALDQLRDSGYLGSGAGAFEPLLAADPPAGIIKLTNLHNAFVELLSQYGIVVGLVHGVSLIMLVAVAAAPKRITSRLSRVQALPLDHRVEIGGYLAAYLAFGIAASSALTFAAWWVLHASACVSWWVAVSARRASEKAITASKAITQPIPTLPNSEGKRTKTPFAHSSRTTVLNECPTFE